ncbi:hypothetical protein ABB02_01222 [Clostridiaceae bacterium JG1575]|nr:hypothetical protein ABB02_01222 [Clostridiaceae bacterium JG1575]
MKKTIQSTARFLVLGFLCLILPGTVVRYFLVGALRHSLLPLFAFLIGGLYILFSFFVLRWAVADPQRVAAQAGLKHEQRVWILIGLGLMLRLLFLFFSKTAPHSDFLTMYESARVSLGGDYQAFFGNGYLARFPHLIWTVLLERSLMGFLGTSPRVIQLFLWGLSGLSLWLLYCVAQRIWGAARAMGALTLFALFPAYIFYPAVLATENIALPLYLGSLLLLLKALGNEEEQEPKKSYLTGPRPVRFLLGSGALLALANMFRFVGYVFFIAWLLVLWLHGSSWRRKIAATLLLGASALLVSAVMDVIPRTLGVTDRWIHDGREPAVTSILKGTNFSSGGMYNEEDANIFAEMGFDSAKTKKEAWVRIHERLRQMGPGKGLLLAGRKLLNNWTSGDFLALDWLAHSDNEGGAVLKGSKWVLWGMGEGATLWYLGLLMLSFYTLWHQKAPRDLLTDLCVLLLAGIMLFLLLIESHPRYGLIAAWIFPLLASGAPLERLLGSSSGKSAPSGPARTVLAEESSPAHSALKKRP